MAELDAEVTSTMRGRARWTGIAIEIAIEIDIRAERVVADRELTRHSDPARSGSHGLGLTFCRLAAEAHGGRIWVEPRDGHVASFCVRIPQPVA